MIQQKISHPGGVKFHGYKTYNGEIYDMYRMTAAHKTLPIPSYLLVKNLNNGIQVVIIVNDRWPFHEKQILDLSYVAAKKLDMLKIGTATIAVTALYLNIFHKKYSEDFNIEYTEISYLPRM